MPRVHHQQTHIVRKPFRQKKKVPEVNMYPHKGMMSIGNDGYFGLMYKVIFLLFEFLSKKVA